MYLHVADSHLSIYFFPPSLPPSLPPSPPPSLPPSQVSILDAAVVGEVLEICASHIHVPTFDYKDPDVHVLVIVCVCTHKRV